MAVFLSWSCSSYCCWCCCCCSWWLMEPVAAESADITVVALLVDIWVGNYVGTINCLLILVLPVCRRRALRRRGEGSEIAKSRWCSCLVLCKLLQGKFGAFDSLTPAFWKKNKKGWDISSFCKNTNYQLYSGMLLVSCNTNNDKWRTLTISTTSPRRGVTSFLLWCAGALEILVINNHRIEAITSWGP